MSEYQFEIRYYQPGDKWIHIRELRSYDLDDELPFMSFLSRVQMAVGGGKIQKVGYIRYRIEGDKNHFIYQWDDCFGIVIETARKANYEKIKKDVQSLLDKINEL